MLTAVSLGSFCLPTASVAEAASAATASSGSFLKRNQFRPWNYSGITGHAKAPVGVVRQADSGRLRSGVPGISDYRRDESAAVFAGRSGSRKAVPITRGQELGQRFRPDERDPVYPGHSGGSTGFGATPAFGQAEFRPTQPRRRATYEELQAQEARSTRQQAFPAPLTYPSTPVLPVPLAPPMLPGWPTR
jgi:hypothetical protein